MLTLEKLAMICALLVGWSAALWGVVLFAKWLAVDLIASDWSRNTWNRIKGGVGFLAGASTGWAYVPVALSLLQVDVNADHKLLVMALGSIFGLGAGAVSSKTHDLLLWKVDDWIRSKKAKG